MSDIIIFLTVHCAAKNKTILSHKHLSSDLLPRAFFALFCTLDISTPQIIRVGVQWSRPTDKGNVKFPCHWYLVSKLSDKTLYVYKQKNNGDNYFYDKHLKHTRTNLMTIRINTLPILLKKIIIHFFVHWRGES